MGLTGEGTNGKGTLIFDPSFLPIQHHHWHLASHGSSATNSLWCLFRNHGKTPSKRGACSGSGLNSVFAVHCQKIIDFSSQPTKSCNFLVLLQRQFLRDDDGPGNGWWWSVLTNCQEGPFVWIIIYGESSFNCQSILGLITFLVDDHWDYVLHILNFDPTKLCPDPTITERHEPNAVDCNL